MCYALRRLPLEDLNYKKVCCQFRDPRRRARTLMPMGPGGEDGDSAVTRRERLHMAGRIGSGRIPDGKLQAGDKGDVVQRVAAFQCTT